MSNYYQEYLWIVIVGCFIGFVYAFGIGANDVANAFASTVSSKSLTLKQAVIAAGIFEFGGAILLGASVTNTIRSKIFDPADYEGEEDIVMLGMFTSLITATIMLFIATMIGLPVSTTQTIVGCIMGFSIAAKGFSSINKEVAYKILISWILSPAISGAVGFLFFGFIKVFIHRSENPYVRAYWLFPVILTVFIGIDLFFIIYKAVEQNYEDALSLTWVLPASFGAGAVCGVIWILIIGPIAKRRVQAHMAADEAAAQEAKDAENAPTSTEGAEEWVETDQTTSEKQEEASDDIAKANEDIAKPDVAMEKAAETADTGKSKSFKEKMKRAGDSFAANTYKQDLATQSFHENKTAAMLWEQDEGYDKETEQMFTYVQVFTACLNSFAHGANDVSNAIAPISAILMIYHTGEISSKAGVPKWILAYGGIAIVLGLLCFGYRVMKSLGYKICALSPSRGASAELAASLWVVTASYNEIPVSSTQAIVGAVTGVGLVGGVKNVGWCFFLKICIGWILEFSCAILLSAGMFSMFAYSPSLN